MEARRGESGSAPRGMRRTRRAGKPTPGLETGAVLLTEDARKTLLVAFQERKKEEMLHPYLQERAPLGLMPHLQAQLLARHLRGDLDDYPPFVRR